MCVWEALYLSIYGGQFAISPKSVTKPLFPNFSGNKWCLQTSKNMWLQYVEAGLKIKPFCSPTLHIYVFCAILSTNSSDHVTIFPCSKFKESFLYGEQGVNSKVWRKHLHITQVNFSFLCLAIIQAESQASYCGGTVSIPRHFMWTKWCFSEYSGFSSDLTINRQLISTEEQFQSRASLCGFFAQFITGPDSYRKGTLFLSRS